MTDIIVIGAGIAGASIAAHLAETHRVLLIEGEHRPGYHSTGRSAALFTEIYGNSVIRALTRASRPFLFAPPPGFSETALIRPRGCLYIATAEQLGRLREFAALPDVAPATRAMTATQARSLCPVLREEYVAGALWESDSTDIDVHALHHGYLRLFRTRGGQLLNSAPVDALEHAGPGWTARAGEQTVTARIVVNAAGAWADEIAALAGVSRLGLVPCRRTAVLVDPPPGMSIGGWPFVNDIDEQFYFKPEAGLLFLSPADETPAPPATRSPKNGMSQPPSTACRAQLRCKSTGSRPAGPACEPSRPIGRRWRAFRVRRRGFSGSPVRAATAFKRRRRCRGRRRPWFEACRCRRICSPPACRSPTCRRRASRLKLGVRH